MSIKDELKKDIKYVKDELSADEKMIEGALKIETLYKKYKLLIWGVVGISVIGFGYKVITDEMKLQKLNLANSALITLQTKPNDKEAQKVLKENNPKLFDLYSFSIAVKDKNTKELDRLSSNKNTLIADISAYHSSVISDKNGNSLYYKNLSLLEGAYSDISNKKIKEGKIKLDMIENKSSVSSLAGLLSHYTIKGE